MLGSPTRTFICMDAQERRDRLVRLLAAYGQLDVVGADVADHRALRSIIARRPGLVLMAPRVDAVGKAAWLTRRVHHALPDCAVVAAAGEGPDLRPAGELSEDRCLPVDAPLTDLIEAALHAARPHEVAVAGGARSRRG